MLLMYLQTWIILLEPFLSGELLNLTFRYKYIQYIATFQIIVLSLNESVNIFPVLV